MPETCRQDSGGQARRDRAGIRHIGRDCAAAFESASRNIDRAQRGLIECRDCTASTDARDSGSLRVAKGHGQNAAAGGLQRAAVGEAGGGVDGDRSAADFRRNQSVVRERHGGVVGEAPAADADVAVQAGQRLDHAGSADREGPGRAHGHRRLVAARLELDRAGERLSRGKPDRAVIARHVRGTEGRAPRDRHLRVKGREEAQVPVDRHPRERAACAGDVQGLAVGEGQRAAVDRAPRHAPRTGGVVQGQRIGAAACINGARDVYRPAGIAPSADAAGGIERAAEVHGGGVHADHPRIGPGACRRDGQDAAALGFQRAGASVGEAGGRVDSDGPAIDLGRNQSVVSERHGFVVGEGPAADADVAVQAGQRLDHAGSADREGPGRAHGHRRLVAARLELDRAGERLSRGKPDRAVIARHVRGAEGRAPRDHHLRVEAREEAQVPMDGHPGERAARAGQADRHGRVDRAVGDRAPREAICARNKIDRSGGGEGAGRVTQGCIGRIQQQICDSHVGAQSHSVWRTDRTDCRIVSRDAAVAIIWEAPYRRQVRPICIGVPVARRRGAPRGSDIGSKDGRCR